jgi:hypothetical protein
VALSRQRFGRIDRLCPVSRDSFASFLSRKPPQMADP